MSDTAGKLARWCIQLSELEFNVVHCAGIKHEATDAPSRLQTKGVNETVSDENFLNSVHSPKGFRYEDFSAREENEPAGGTVEAKIASRPTFLMCSLSQTKFRILIQMCQNVSTLYIHKC